MTELKKITTIAEFADVAAEIITRFDMVEAIECVHRIHGNRIRVFDLLEVSGSSETGDEEIDQGPPRWVVSNHHSGETVSIKDSGWALCCFITAYVALIEQIENADATREDEEW
jgi:hypothetical protein